MNMCSYDCHYDIEVLRSHMTMMYHMIMTVGHGWIGGGSGRGGEIVQSLIKIEEG